MGPSKPAEVSDDEARKLDLVVTKVQQIGELADSLDYLVDISVFGYTSADLDVPAAGALAFKRAEALADYLAISSNDTIRISALRPTKFLRTSDSDAQDSRSVRIQVQLVPRLRSN